MPRSSLARLSLVLAVLAGSATSLMAQEGRQSTHTVKSGDTLWDLARRYLGDPFLWPAIYRLNTDVVEDPHWIYPDEVLRLSAAGDVTSVPLEDTPPPAPLADGDTLPPAGDDWKRFFVNRDDRMANAIAGLDPRTYRPLRPSEFHSSGFLTEGRDIAWGKLNGRVTPVQIPARYTRETMQLFQRVYVTPPSGTVWTQGDSLMTVELADGVGGYGDVVIPTGILRVTEVAPGRTVAEVIALYADMVQGQRVMPAEKFQAAGNRQAIPVADGVAARVLGSPQTQTLYGPQDVMFLDKGRSDGVAPGDIFEIRRSQERRDDGVMSTPDVMAVLQVVRVGDRTATARVLRVVSPSILAGTESRQVARLPS